MSRLLTSMPGAIQSIMQGFKESLTNAMRIINTDHAYIHDGIGFISYLELGSMAHSTSESYSLYIPSEKYVHLKNLKLSAVGATVKLSVKRGTTTNPLSIDDSGNVASELTGPHNTNDNSDNTTGVEVKKTPTYTNSEEGEVWDSIQVLGDSTNQFTSIAETSYGENFELVLKSNTSYVLTFTNMSSTDSAFDVLLKMFWYEEDGGLA